MRILFEVIGFIVGLPLAGLMFVFIVDVVFGTSILGTDEDVYAGPIMLSLWAGSVLVAFAMGAWGYRRLKGYSYDTSEYQLEQAGELKEAADAAKKQATEESNKAQSERVAAEEALAQVRALQQQAAEIKAEIRKGPSAADLGNVPAVVVEDLTVEGHLERVEGWLTQAQEDEDKTIKGKLHGQIIRLVNLVAVVFEKKGLVAPEKLLTVPKDVERVDQIEALIDLYTEKIRAVENDDSLDEEMRGTKIDYWRRLMETDIARLEAS